MDYEVFISSDAIAFLLERMEVEGTRLLFEVQRLGSNPFREPDFTDHDEKGDIHGVLSQEYALLFQVDHAAKRIYVADVTYADQI